MPGWTPHTGLWAKMPWLLLFLGIFILLVHIMMGEQTQDTAIDKAHTAVLDSQAQVKANAIIMWDIHEDLLELRRVVEDQCKDKKAPKWR